MNDSIIPNTPKILTEIEAKSKEIGFTMGSDFYVGSLLKTLVASKPQSRLLELDSNLSQIAKGFFGKDKTFTCAN